MLVKEATGVNELRRVSWFVSYLLAMAEWLRMVSRNLVNTSSGKGLARSTSIHYLNQCLYIMD